MTVGEWHITFIALTVMLTIGFGIWLKYAVGLSPKSEHFLWIVCASGAGVAFLTSHTFYITKETYARGAVLFGVTAFLSYMRFRRRRTPRTKNLIFTSNVVLLILGVLVGLFLLGVVTWYE